MKTNLWLFCMAWSVAVPALAGLEADKDLDQFAHSAAKGVPGAREVVGEGQAKWAGVWMDKELTCPNGRLGADGQRLLAEGGRYAAGHDANLILYAPRANAPTMEREARTLAANIKVRGNDMIGDHCYLVIQK